MGFQLTIVGGKGAGEKFAFVHRIVRVGRSSDNDLVLYDTSVSRAHCEIVEDGAAFTIRDLGSSNGIKVNERVSTESQLKDGDHLKIGAIVFEFRGRIDKDARSDGRGMAFAPQDANKRPVNDQQTTGANEPVLDLKDLAAEAARQAERRKSRRALKLSGRSFAAIGLVVGLLLACVIVFVMRGHRADRSNEMFYPQLSNMRFGSGRVDINTPDRVNFQFVFNGGRVTVGYASGGIDTRDELAILVNGKLVAYAPMSPNAWSTGLTFEIPRSALRVGNNVLTFDNTMTPGREEHWGVSQVTVKETPLPPADPKRAKELYDLGRAAFDARSVTPPNLSRAIDYLGEARAYVEGASTPPPILQQIEQLEAQAKAELQSVFDTHLVASEKAQRFGDREEAAQVLREVLRYFPEQDDPRYVQAQTRLKALSGAVIK